jgi:hypothetical protein
VKVPRRTASLVRARTARRFELRGEGKDEVRDRVLHAHEAHHAMLNDSATWGIALRLAARHRPWQALSLPLRDAGRPMHESFATFMGVSAAFGRFPQAERVLEQYVKGGRCLTRTSCRRWAGLRRARR